MARAPNHMAGINALPKWDPANPTAYRYDPLNYDRADYAKFKAARRAHDTAAYKESQKRLKTMEKNVSKEMNAAIRENIYGEVKKVQPSRAEMQAAAKAGKSLHALMPSTCLQSLTWKKGVTTAEFYRGGAITYEYEMDLDEFVSWAQSGSLGKYGNENVF